MTTVAIDTHEERNVAVIDLPGAYLHAYSDEEVLMLLKGPLAELMVMVDPAIYKKYVIYDSKKEAMLYVKINKALYGLLHSALLFYNKLVADLKAYGFVVNPYDPCVANNTTGDLQMTVTWHVDDLKVSHKDQTAIDDFAKWLRGKYERKDQDLFLTHHEGKVHDYLGIDLDYSEKKKLKVSMIKYIDKIFKGFSEDIGTPVADPAASHLFQVREDGEAKYL